YTTLFRSLRQHQIEVDRPVEDGERGAVGIHPWVLLDAPHERLLVGHAALEGQLTLTIHGWRCLSHRRSHDSRDSLGSHGLHKLFSVGLAAQIGDLRHHPISDGAELPSPVSLLRTYPNRRAETHGHP